MRLSLAVRPARANWAEGPCADRWGAALAIRREKTHRLPGRKRVNLHGVTDWPFRPRRKGSKGRVRVARNPIWRNALSGGFRVEPGSKCAAEAMQRCFHNRARGER